MFEIMVDMCLSKVKWYNPVELNTSNRKRSDFEGRLRLNKRVLQITDSLESNDHSTKIFGLQTTQ